MKQRTIDANTARKLAVKADCDPRTVRDVLASNGKTKTIAGQRARAALIAAGLLKPEAA
jgi:hypothetical protein